MNASHAANVMDSYSCAAFYYIFNYYYYSVIMLTCTNFWLFASWFMALLALSDLDFAMFFIIAFMHYCDL